MKKLILIAFAVMMFAATNADAETANPSDATVTVNGAPVQMAAYNLYGSNYFKLRDVAAALNGTEKQFSVDWLASYQYIILDSGKSYDTANELYESPQVSDAEYNVPTIRKECDGKFTYYNLVGYNISDNNYFKIRDIARIFDFDVEYENGIINVDTSKSYSLIMPEETAGELLGMAYEAALPLFINEMPLVSYYSPCETVYDEEQLQRISEIYRLNGVYVAVLDLPQYGFDISEDENSIYLTRNRDKEFVPLDSSTVNSAPNKVYEVYGAKKKVYLDNVPVRSIETEHTSLIAASELIRYGDVEKRPNIGGFPVIYDFRINLDFLNTELNNAYDEATDDPQVSFYPEDDTGKSVKYKSSVNIGRINLYKRGVESEYIGGCNAFKREGIGVYLFQYNPTGGAGLAPTRYIQFERGIFVNDTLYDGISYRQITEGGNFGGERIEGARVDGYQRRGTIMRNEKDYNIDDEHFRFGYRITNEGDIKDGEYCGEYKAYDENGELIYTGLYSNYQNGQREVE